MTPKYELLKPQLFIEIERLSKDGESKFPTEAILCQKYKVSRQTLRKATDLLINDGLLTRIQGSGCYLTDKAMKLSKKEAALIIDTDSEYNDPLIIHELRESLYLNNVNLNIYVTNGLYSNEKSYINELLNSNINILFVKPILSAIPNPNEYLFRKLIQNGVSVFFINNIYTNTNSFSIFTPDDFSGGYQIVEYAKSLSLSNIATIFKMDDKSGIERFHGVMNAISDFNLSYNENNINWYTEKDLANLRKKTDIDFLMSFAQKSIDTCSAIICQNDEIGYWLHKCINNINPQKKPLVLSFEKSYLANLADNNYTSLPFNYREYITSIVSMAIDSISNKKIVAYKHPWEIIRE